MCNERISFEEIALSKRELRFFKRSAKAKIELSKCPRLKSLQLVDEELQGTKGLMPIHTGMAEINEKGISYLAYIKRRNSEYRATRLISVIALVISLLSLIVQAVMSLWQQ